MKVTKDKTYETKSGHKVRIYSTDGGGKCPIHGAWLDDDGKLWVNDCWRENGRYFPDDEDEDGLDLVEVRPRIKLKRWVNVLKVRNAWAGDGMGLDIHHTKRSAEEYNYTTYAPSEVVARAVEIEIDVDEGHGM